MSYSVKKKGSNRMPNLKHQRHCWLPARDASLRVLRCKRLPFWFSLVCYILHHPLPPPKKKQTRKQKQKQKTGHKKKTAKLQWSQGVSHCNSKVPQVSLAISFHLEAREILVGGRGKPVERIWCKQNKYGKDNALIMEQS